MKLNPDMLTLAREYRAMSQEELAVATGLTQPQVARLEAGLKSEISEEVGNKLADALSFPSAFLAQEEVKLGFGSSSYFYRKKATIPAAERKKIQSMVNLLRMAIKGFLPHVEIQPSRNLPQWSIENYGYSAANVAQALRAHWHLPDGPIRDLTGLVESAGVVVVPCDFGVRSIDATSLRLSDMPPMVFMNVSVPGDRWRFTLAHELAHLVMHQEPHENMELEANAFAGEFLVPANEIRPQLARLQRLQVRDLMDLKRYWRVSMQSLIFRAYEADSISESSKKSLIVRMSQLNMRQAEPEPIERESPSNLARTVATMTDALNFSVEELGETLNWNPADVRALLPITESRPVRRLRAV